MFRRILAILFILASVLSFSQNVTDPVPLRTNLLANSELLRENLQLFTTDTVAQILFNPARAIDYRKSFLFFNYLPGRYYDPYSTVVYVLPSSYDPFNPVYNSNDITPSFSFVSLFNFIEAKWLFQIDNQNARHSSDIAVDFVNQPLNIDLLKYSRSNHNILSSTTAKLSYISYSSLLGTFSAGIYFTGFNRNSDSFSLEDEFLYYSYNNGIDNYNSRTANSHLISDAEQNLRKYNFGIEFTLKSNTWDYRGRAGYQTNKKNFIDIDGSNYINIDSSRSGNTWVIRNTNSQVNSNNNYIFKPNTINIEQYISHRLRLINPDDNIYFSGSGYAAKGDIDLHQDYKNDFVNTDTAMLIEGITEYSSKLNDWGINLAAGYVLRKSFSDLFILSGINIEAAYSKQTDISFSSPYSSGGKLGFTNYNLKFYTANLMLPVYVKYSPAEWISIVGGINFTYYFSESRYSLNTSVLVPTVNNEVEPTFASMQENGTLLNSYSDNFIGLELNHPSGFRAQVSFNRSISETRYWSASLGYSF